MKAHRIINVVFAVAVALTAVVLSYAPPALAHGERSQEPFLRMRSIQWYDAAWSKTKVAVNEEMQLTGKFHIFEEWPDVLLTPDVVFLNYAAAGPVFTRESSSLNGVNAVRSTALQIGADYEYKITLRGRKPGRWHVHPILNVFEAGPIIGPGRWVTIEGSMADFRNPAVTLTGEEIDLETYGVANVVTWHVLWAIPALFWILWWARRPIFFMRMKAIQEGNLAGLITPADNIVAVVLLVGSIVGVIAAYNWASNQWPVSIPLQTGLIKTPPIIRAEPVDAKVLRATYRVPGRAMVMDLQVTNNGDTPMQLGMMETGTVRFINPGVGKVDPGYPAYLTAEAGLKVEPQGPIFPGETKILKVVASDAAWENERLSSLIHDPDSRFGAQVFFYDEEGSRSIKAIGGPLLPVFK
jgi:methane/ammonia monooxygenase subunit B